MIRRPLRRWPTAVLGLLMGCAAAPSGTTVPAAPEPSAEDAPEPAPEEVPPPSSAEEVGFGCVYPDDRPTTLSIRLSEPRSDALAQLSSAFGPEVPLLCGTNGLVFVTVPRARVESMLGADQCRFRCTLGAGNSTTSKDYRADLLRSDFVPAAWQPAALLVAFENDPKRQLFEEHGASPCSEKVDED